MCEAGAASDSWSGHGGSALAGGAGTRVTPRSPPGGSLRCGAGPGGESDESGWADLLGSACPWAQHLSRGRCLCSQARHRLTKQPAELDGPQEKPPSFVLRGPRSPVFTARAVQLQRPEAAGFRDRRRRGTLFYPKGPAAMAGPAVLEGCWAWVTQGPGGRANVRL